MHTLKAGEKPPAGSTVTLYRDNGTSPLPTAVEWFYADDVLGWTCPVTTNGFFYAYETRNPTSLRVMAIKLNNLMPDELRNSLEFRQAVCACLAAESTPTAELARALRSADWAVRVCAPWALKLAADCAESSGREADAASMRASAEKLIAHPVNDAVSAKSAADAAADAAVYAFDRAVAYVDDNDAYADDAAAYTDGVDAYADDADNAIRAAAYAAHTAARAADRAADADADNAARAAAKAAADARADAYANADAMVADAAAYAARAAADAAAYAADAAAYAARAAAAYAARAADSDAARAADSDAIWHGAIKLFAELVSMKG